MLLVMEDIVEKIESKLHLILESSTMKDNRLFQAISYSLFTGGKRIRPFLIMVIAQVFNINDKYSLNVAAAIELIHTYSLIHDDLPCMDNDNFRRGKPTCHIQFDETTALLAGDALQSLAFEILASEETHPDPSVRCELIGKIAEAIGINGMAGGQMIDIQAQTVPANIEELIKLQQMKTGELFAISCEAGAILAKVPADLRTALRDYALSLGQAFQIIDDIEDFDSNSEKTGNNFLYFLNKEEAYQRAKLLVTQAKSCLSPIKENIHILKEFADSIL